jgi:hypothetical protein
MGDSLISKAFTGKLMDAPEPIRPDGISILGKIISIDALSTGVECSKPSGDGWEDIGDVIEIYAV